MLSDPAQYDRTGGGGGITSSARECEEAGSSGLELV